MSGLNERVFFSFPYCVLFCGVRCLLVACTFLKGDGSRMDLLGREVREVEGVETLAGIICLREESIQQK